MTDRVAATGEEFIVDPDPRMAHFIGGLDESGRAVPISPGRLSDAVSTWPRTAATPAGVAGLLKTSRDLFVHGYFVYEFITIGVLVSIQAVESSLRLRLNSRQTFVKLIDRATDVGLLNQEDGERLHAGRELRNHFSHPNEQAVWSFGMASSIISASHEIVAALFVDKVDAH